MNFFLTKATAYANCSPPPVREGQVYLTASQIARRWGISRTSFWRLRSEKPDFPAHTSFTKTKR